MYIVPPGFEHEYSVGEGEPDFIQKYLPPGFQHECSVGEGESNLSQPDSQRAGQHVGPGIQHDRLQQRSSKRKIVQKKDRPEDRSSTIKIDYKKDSLQKRSSRRKIVQKKDRLEEGSSRRKVVHKLDRLEERLKVSMEYEEIVRKQAHFKKVTSLKYKEIVQKWAYVLNRERSLTTRRKFEINSNKIVWKKKQVHNMA